MAHNLSYISTWTSKYNEIHADENESEFESETIDGIVQQTRPREKFFSIFKVWNSNWTQEP